MKHQPNMLGLCILLAGLGFGLNCRKAEGPPSAQVPGSESPRAVASTPTPTPTPAPTTVPDPTPAPTPPVTTDQPGGGPASSGSSTWSRASLKPLYELTPRAEYARFRRVDGDVMSDSDFTAQRVRTSAAQKMDQVALLVKGQNIIAKPEDRQRAIQIPFRGNPTDVKWIAVDGQKKIFVPLGGDLMTPGNEVAVVANNRTETRIAVGLRPQRLAVHPSGLIFVCNQFSNFVSVIDAASSQLLRRDGEPVEIKTEVYCSDLVLVPQDPRSGNDDRAFLYVANRWRHSVLKYRVEVLRDPITDRPIDVRQGSGAGADHTPVTEILGVGVTPHRMALSEQKDALFVANVRGGVVSRIELRSDTVSATQFINAPASDVVNVEDLLFFPTTTVDRGLLAAEDQHPSQVLAAPVRVSGLDGALHEAHPGAIFDGTHSYNFEDVRNGLLQTDAFFRAGRQAVYYTDDVSSEPNFVNQQKIVAGGMPTSIVRNDAGSQLFVTLGGTHNVQQFLIDRSRRPFVLRPGRLFRTGFRPYGLALDEEANRIYVSNWGSETLQIFDLNNEIPIATIDLGYAEPAYPATNIERGEFFWYDTRWSNNGRKSCATCHFDELLTDGLGFSNGVTTPTAYHQVKPNYNLMTTDAYFWNGSFSTGDYTSLAFASQTRTNCELILFGLIDGPGSDPNTRIGDRNNFVTDEEDTECRPITIGLSQLANEGTVNQILAARKSEAKAVIERVTGFAAEEVSKFLDFYSVSELRLPPNPSRQLYELGLLGEEARSEIERGQALFRSSGCAGCHDPGNARSPFSDGLNHGSGADWTERFVRTYFSDPRIIDSIGTFSETLLSASRPATPDGEVNVYVDPLDFFTPLCFDATDCLSFEDPLAVRGNEAEETRRLNLLIDVNLANEDRGFIPGNVRGAIQVNTPSLRGVWSQGNLLHHGLARTIKEAVLGPGHPHLGPTETGWAVDARGRFDVHGKTSALGDSEIRALVRYVESIE